MPIPLHITRQRQRGFNQSEVLAAIVAKYLELPLVKALKRIKKTKPQIDLPQELRAQNIKGAFLVEERVHALKGKSVILVDDVYTTGATMKEAAKILKRAGAKEVTGLVIAKQD